MTQRWRSGTPLRAAIRKDDPAKHLDKLIAAGDGRKTPGIVAPLERARAEKTQHTI